MLRPAVEGTLNVLRACTHARVQRIILTSSIGAVYMNPNLPPEKIYDASCWSDEHYLRDTKVQQARYIYILVSSLTTIEIRTGLELLGTPEVAPDSHRTLKEFGVILQRSP